MRRNWLTGRSIRIFFWRAALVQVKVHKFSTVTSVSRGSTFALRRSTLDFCLGGQRSLGSDLSAVVSHKRSLAPLQCDWLTLLKMTAWVVGTTPPSLERERARDHQIASPKNTEKELDVHHEIWEPTVANAL